MTITPEILASAARARGIKQATAIGYQRRIGRVIFAREARKLPFSLKNIIDDLNAVGIPTSQGGPWTRSAVQGVRARLRRRCALDPGFAEALLAECAESAQDTSWSPLGAHRAQIAAHHAAEIAEQAASHAASWAAAVAVREATKKSAEQARQALVEARREANRLAREARRAGRNFACGKSRAARAAMGTEARRKQAKEYRQGVWLAVAPMIEAQLKPSAIAAELNRRGVPRLQTTAEWTTDAVCKMRAAIRGSSLS